MEEHKNNEAAVLIRVIVLAGLVWLLPIFAIFMPRSRLWGFNHLTFLPPIFLYVYIILGL